VLLVPSRQAQATVADADAANLVRPCRLRRHMKTAPIRFPKTCRVFSCISYHEHPVTLLRPRSTCAAKLGPAGEIGLVHVAPGLLGKTSRVRLLMFWIVGLMGFLAVILAVLHLGSLQKMAELIRPARPGWMVVSLAVQSATYVSAALVWRVALRQAGHPLSMRILIPLGVANVFTDQVLPSGGTSGTMLVVRGLTGRHMPAGTAMAAMLVGMVSYDIAYLFVVLASAGALWLQHRLDVALIAGAVTFVVVSVAVPAAALGLKQWGRRVPVAWLSKCRGVTALLQELTDALTRIRCLDALGRVRELYRRVVGRPPLVPFRLVWGRSKPPRLGC
jgi:hypothetical protein